MSDICDSPGVVRLARLPCAGCASSLPFLQCSLLASQFAPRCLPQSGNRFGTPRRSSRRRSKTMESQPKRLRVGIMLGAAAVGAALGGAAIAGAATGGTSSATSTTATAAATANAPDPAQDPASGRDAAHRYDRRQGEGGRARGGARRHDHPGRDRLGRLALRGAHDQGRRHRGDGEGRRRLQGHRRPSRAPAAAGPGGPGGPGRVPARTASGQRLSALGRHRG